MRDQEKRSVVSPETLGLPRSQQVNSSRQNLSILFFESCRLEVHYLDNFLMPHASRELSKSMNSEATSIPFFHSSMICFVDLN